MRRLRLILLTIAAIAVILMVGLWIMWPRSAITRANYERIQIGMTLATVEQILDGPARDESSGPLNTDGGWDDQFRFAAIQASGFSDPELKLWRSNHLLIQIQIDEHGRVCSKDSVEVRVADENTLDMVRRWLGL